MRIGFDVSKVAMPRDGIGTYSGELLRALAVFATDDCIRAHVLIEPVDREELREALAGLSERIELAARPPSEDDLDVFHSTTLAWPQEFQGPVVMTCHDLTFVTHPECHTLENRLHCIEGMVRGAINDAHVLAVSRATADAAQDCFGVSQEAASCRALCCRDGGRLARGHTGSVGRAGY